MAEKETRRHGDLQTGEDMRAERREWVIQRVGWGVMALALAAGIAGVCGSGPLAKGSVGEVGLQIAYPRIARYNSPSELEVRVVAAGPSLRLWLPATYAKQAGLSRIAPEPVAVALAGDRYLYDFPVGSSGEHRVVFHLEPDEVGAISGEVGVEGGASVKFRHFVVP